MSPIPRIRNYTMDRPPFSYDPLDPYANQEFGRPAVPPSPPPPVPPSPVTPVNPMIQAIEEGRFEEYEPPIPPSPTGGFQYEEPASVKALREHSQAMPEYEKPPWWKTAAGLALSTINVAPAQIGARKLLYGDYPREMAEWEAKRGALEKSAGEEAGLTKGRMTFEQQRMQDESDLAEKGLVQVDINDPEFKRSDYETLTTVGSKVWGKPKERVTAKEVAKDTRLVPRSVFKAAGLEHLLGPEEQSRRMSNKEAEELFGSYLEQIKPISLSPGQVRVGGPEGKETGRGLPRQQVLYPGAQVAEETPGKGLQLTGVKVAPLPRRAAGTTDPYQSTRNQIEAEFRRNVERVLQSKEGEVITWNGIEISDGRGMSEEEKQAAIQRAIAARDVAYEMQLPGQVAKPLPPQYLEMLGVEAQPGAPAAPPPPGPAVGPPPPGAQAGAERVTAEQVQYGLKNDPDARGMTLEQYKQKIRRDAAAQGVTVVFE
jgi:hypothetical protein